MQVRKETLADAQAKKEFTKQVPTEYSRNNTTIDRGRTTDYWTKPTEMLARAFSSFVEDSAQEKGYTTDFLSYGSDNRLILFGKPFPEGKERKAINQAFRDFFKVVQKEIAQTKEETGEIKFSVRALNPKYQAAYHGTPHVFDTFSVDKIGTGEGNQVHGWGLYFAKKRDVAEFYRNALTESKEGIVQVGNDTYIPRDVWNNLWIVNGEYAYLDDVENEVLQLVSDYHGDIDKTIVFMKDVLKTQPSVKSDKEAQKFYRNAIKYLENHRSEISIPEDARGRIFEVDIPESDVLLDENTSFKHQDDNVKKQIVDAIQDLPDEQKTEFVSGLLEEKNQRWYISKAFDKAYGAYNEAS